MLAGNVQRRLKPRRLTLDHGKSFARLASDNRRHIALDDAGLFSGDLFERIAEKFAVVERQPGDDAGQRVFDHIGGVEPAAEPDFEQQHVGRIAREQQKPRGGLDLEYRDRRLAVFGFAFGERRGELGIADQLAAVFAPNAKPFVDTHQVRRRIDMHALARRFEDRAHEGYGRALAIGAGNVDHRRQMPLRVIERVKDARHALEPEVDALGVQRQKPRQHGVDRRSSVGRPFAHVVAGSGAGRLTRCTGALAGALVKSRHNLAMVARNSWRCTTMSTMPWSRRYSAF